MCYTTSAEQVRACSPEPPATHLGFLLNADPTCSGPTGLLLPRAGKVKGSPTTKQQSCPFLVISTERTGERSHLREEKSTTGKPVLFAIPVLATWGRLAPAFRAPGGPGFAAREGCELGNPYPAGLGAAGFHQHLRAGDHTTQSQVSGGWQLPV